MTTKSSLRRLALVLVAGLVAGALAATATASRQAGRSDGARLHIDATFDSYLDFNGNASCVPPLLLVIGVGTARGTHISSHATATAEECSDAQTSPGFFLVHGMGTFTTPNGDVLYLDYHETSNAPDFSQPNPVLYDQGTFAVVGGTGRFAGATGSGSISAVVPIVYDPATGLLRAHVTAQYDGRIELGR